MEFLIFLGALGVIVLQICIANEFQRIADMKGHTEKRYFWWSLLFGPVGWAMVIALPARGEKTAPAPADAAFDDLPEI